MTERRAPIPWAHPWFDGITPTGKLVWREIYDAGEGEYGRRELAERLGVSQRAVDEALERLLDRGLLERTAPPRGRRVARFRARVPDLEPAAA